MNGKTRPVMQFETLQREHEAARVGTWVFLSTEVLFIGALFASYTMMRVDYPTAFAEASRHTKLVLGTVNTAILLTSSLTMAMAVRAGMLGDNRGIFRWLLVTLLLGFAFLGVKGLEYYQEYQEGFVPGLKFDYTGPDPRHVALFYFLYFVMTGLHAVHLFVGTGLVLAVALMARAGRFNADYSTPVEMVGLYWHFVDIVWIFLYPLIYLVSRT
jgi:cytochrome c oxidase subunit 3